jgi:2,4-dienoyl-CoA reductase-like NADH-dependent reductase (Old Yellow Enzyme family)
VPENILGEPLVLPCGAWLSNRLCKAAMTEGLADSLNRATERHLRLYRRWSLGGAGLLISGNVQIDRRHLERASNIAIDGNGGLDELRALAKAGTEGGNHLWMQIMRRSAQRVRSRINDRPLMMLWTALHHPQEHNPLVGRTPAEAIAHAEVLWEEGAYASAHGCCVVDTDDGTILWRSERRR